MKKYLLGILAIGLAVGLSSFTISRTPVKKSGKTFTDYFWYTVDPSNSYKTISLAFPTKESEAYAINHISDCDDLDDNTAPCLSGFDSQVGSGQSLPADEGQIVRATPVP